ncbi:MAG TPA: hypothetical protein VNQ80_07765 [Parapedobacter sp.]|uniref:hypothetical protein n=1 Tax=Parapedobacter sp. TaxID=1958893 RepID=UPI002CAB893B|nr:hypothetical protein [Parapedobacter sp.]HWK57216.1 hypothetical protein [Parapedobacter sp.]
MSTSTKDKYTTADGYSYMTKRMVVSKAQAAGKKAAKAAMDTMGYVVTVQDGWVVRKNEDGSIERIKQL